jgi:aminoglycoside 3-N-acetyltransferase
MGARHGEAVTAHHGLAFPFGEAAPLARLYELDATVLLLGAPYGACTSFHLAEHRTGNRRTIPNGTPILSDGARVRRWSTTSRSVPICSTSSAVISNARGPS